MTKSKKSIAMHGTLLCPLVLGHCAFLRANGTTYRTSTVVAIHEQSADMIHTQHPLLVGRGTTCAFITGHRLLMGCCSFLNCLQLSFNFFSFTMMSWFSIFVFICIPAFLIFDISSKPFPAFGQKNKRG